MYITVTNIVDWVITNYTVNVYDKVIKITSTAFNKNLLLITNFLSHCAYCTRNTSMKAKQIDIIVSTPKE